MFFNWLLSIPGPWPLNKIKTDLKLAIWMTGEGAQAVFV